MNFYFPAVDDLLRHPQDGPSMGIILCRNRNAMVVEYTLRDTARLMGVARYELHHMLPDELKSSLPDAADLEALIGRVCADSAADDDVV
jgi:hypothetical protein